MHYHTSGMAGRAIPLSIASDDMPSDNTNVNNQAAGEATTLEVRSPKEMMITKLQSMHSADGSDPKAHDEAGCCAMCRYLCCCMDKASFESLLPEGLTKEMVVKPQVRLVHLMWSSLLVTMIGTLDTESSIVPMFMGFILISFVLVMSLVCCSACCGCNESDVDHRSISARVNEVLGIPYPNASKQKEGEVNVEALFDIDRRYWGLAFVTSICACAFNRVVMAIAWPMPEELRVICRAQSYTTGAEHGACAVHWSPVARLYVFALACSITFTSYKRVDLKIVESMNAYFASREQFKDSAAGLTPTVQKVRERVQDHLKSHWKASKGIDKRISELVVIFIVGFVFHFGNYGIAINHINEDPIEFTAFAFCIYLYLTDAAIMTALMYLMLTEAAHHFRFPGIIMAQLGKPLKANHVQDLISWWQLREYYIKCVVDIYASSLIGYISAFLIGFLIFAMFSIFWSSEGEHADVIRFLLMFVAGAIGCFVLSLVSQAVFLYTGQLSHEKTLNREDLRLSCMGYEKHGYVFEQIVADVVDNSQPMVVFGIAITPAFLSALQGIGVTLFGIFVLGE